ncbi:MAG: IS630 family transposase [Bacteroidia bacterium]|nr:IS630 family transposase [Bacteroidia bacterium]
MVKTEELVDKIHGFDFLASYKVERDPRIKIKLLALHHLQNGKSIQDVSEITLYNSKSVKSWLENFIAFDYEGLIEREGRGRKPRLPCEEEESFKTELCKMQDSKPGGSLGATEIRTMLADQFDCCYSRSGTYALLDRLNLVWITGRSKHPKSSQEAIELYKELFPLEVENIKSFIDGEKIEIWWQDESRIGQQGSLSRVWATKGTRPRVVRQKQFLSTYIFGAVCPDRDVGCALILPECNAGMMQIHLDEISATVRKGYHAIVLMDRASWHTTETLNIPENISLLPLPPYSPELNPMEQVWQKLKKSYLSNTAFKDYDSIVEACCNAWNVFCDQDGAIKNLCSRSWAQI